MENKTEQLILEKSFISSDKSNQSILILKNSKGQEIDSEFDENFESSDEEVILEEIVLGN